MLKGIGISMKSKMNMVISATVIFYFFIFMHRNVFGKYGDDYILQALFYIALSFSVLVLEESFRRDIGKLKILSIIDFSLRIVVLVLHFIYILAELNLSVVNIITSSLVVINLVVQFILYRRSKLIQEELKETVSSTELKEFMRNFYINNRKGTSKELIDLMGTIKLSGKGNFVGILLFIAMFISYFVNKYFPHFLPFYMILVAILLVIFIKLYADFVTRAFPEAIRKHKKIITIESIGFLLGYSIIFSCEVFLQETLGVMRVSVWIIGCLALIPIMNRKISVREKLKTVYSKNKRDFA